MHAPEATNWEGPDSGQMWYAAECTDPAVVEAMMSTAIQVLAGQDDDANAWDALFRHFNVTHGHGDRGYVPGEKVGVKLNLVTCWAAYGNYAPWVDPITREKTRYPNHVDVAPQMVRALLRQLVGVVGCAEADIAVGDTTALWPNAYFDPLAAEFPNVQYVDNLGGAGRTRAEFSDHPVYWSTPTAANAVVDYVPTMFADADYVINFAVLKGHSSGITVCGKNHYGSLIRLPNGHLRHEGKLNYYDLHVSLPNREYAPGYGHYRAMVDLMGHPDLGGKTVLYLVDGLYGGYYAESRPRPWMSAPFGDGVNGDWPSSLLASQDPVAIDSVAHDFLLNEWPDVVTGGVRESGSLQGGQEDYLHEAAQADAPPSGARYDPDGDGQVLASLGAHEHWDNPVDKRYSRNLGADQGIELLRLRLDRPPPELRAVISRRTHGTRGSHDITLPLEGARGTEPRRGGPRTLVFTFDVPIQRAAPRIIAGTATVTGSTIADNRVTVQLSGVANLQWLTVGLEGIEGVDGGYLGGASVVVGCIEGDVNQDRMTSTLDVGLVRVMAGAYADATNFRRDINADGLISTLDVGLVRVRAGNILP